MVPARLLLSLASAVLSEHIPTPRDAFPTDPTASTGSDAAYAPTIRFAKREINKHDNPGQFIAFACLIPILVILSGVFAGLTLGYMSLDETQLHVLSLSGTPKQREYANKIKPVRKNGHLLLVTLLLANMIVNETLPVISDPILGGGFEAVVVSTVLIVIFSEIIPQSVCTRYGLYIGATMAGPVKVLIYTFGMVAWPVAKLLEFVLGPHHGIIYRRAELKELIAMHASQNPLGGDLRKDTVTIIGATLDLQDKTVRHAMTPINKVFMLHIDSKLDYDTLRRICATGHSRIPVYEEVEVSIPAQVAVAVFEAGYGVGFAPGSEDIKDKASSNPTGLIRVRVKKIRGILLVKQCVLLDPEDAVPVRKMRLNKVPIVPQNEPLLGILDRFQEGRSHMAIVSRISNERAQSVKKAVKKGLTHRLLGAVRGDSSSSDSSSEDGDEEEDDGATEVEPEKHSPITKIKNDEVMDSDAGVEDGGEAAEGKHPHHFRGRIRKPKHLRRKSKHNDGDLEKGNLEAESKREKRGALEQTMPADAVLSKANAAEYIASQAFTLEPELMPLGIITLEDILEELIGEEIYDEFDVEGTGAHSQSFVPPGADQLDPRKALVKKNSAPELAGNANKDRMIAGSITPPARQTAPSKSLGLSVTKPIAIPNLANFKNILRSRSAPPTPREPAKSLPPAGADPLTASDPPQTDNTSAINVSESLARSAPQLPAGVGDTRGLAQIVESPSVVSSSDDKQSGSAVTSQVQAATLVVPKASPASPTFTFSSGNPAAATPRSGSPAPSLEAILVDRKRRAQMGGSGLSTSSGPPSPSAGIAVPLDRPSGMSKSKGGFKSSPLSLVPPDTDVVTAEEIKKQRQVAKQKDQALDAPGESTVGQW